MDKVFGFKRIGTPRDHPLIFGGRLRRVKRTGLKSPPGKKGETPPPHHRKGERRGAARYPPQKNPP